MRSVLSDVAEAISRASRITGRCPDRAAANPTPNPDIPPPIMMMLFLFKALRFWGALQFFITTEDAEDTENGHFMGN
jgi:hypothetical protein